MSKYISLIDNFFVSNVNEKIPPTISKYVGTHLRFPKYGKMILPFILLHSLQIADKTKANRASVIFPFKQQFLIKNLVGHTC